MSRGAVRPSGAAQANAAAGVSQSAQDNSAAPVRAAYSLRARRVPASLLWCGVIALWLSAGCDDKQAASAGEPSAAVSAVPSAPPPPPLPWFVGTWAGEYESKHFLIEMEAKDGAVLNWKRDDGGAHSGKGELELSIDEEGAVSGISSGPLGAFTVTGTLEEELLSVQFMPRPGTQVTSAVFMGKREGEGFKGTLRASTGDSLTVRQAEVSLSKASAELKHEPGQVAEAPSAAPDAVAEAGAPSGAAPDAGAAPAAPAAPGAASVAPGAAPAAPGSATSAP